ncbi:phosphoadenylyl-sulfate reductase [Moraxella catarrhalis]|uniref:phosphoadenylyl-sulfate reductase n=1 Tax=Moraxella catarrhalis TaxID=480 RepID=UPI0001D26009|nr:phosphoadenylyl-sulfate reductase [Moraxella catarrhalis]ADG60368.1 phosphoadenosine phosphosulfate reductase [Moraxella catarrhalis BBH18]AXT92637.1 phosphoadenosine phosphosulfate reductase [Moraxella catarrhalis]EGE12169.1 phosphoadenosine phosphosulfate reductase [Moraxella catarrhalis 7169]MPW55517.1 phosphoadenylyl-sulfate reductase [Moraxella catarrhalis]MPW76302.1 phosphoadenylyl-sulfate reductase [Moraxella catarrhalis]
MMIKPILWRIPVPSDETIQGLDAKIKTLHARLSDIHAKHHTVKFASSLQAEDMVITDALANSQLSTEIFILQTGRLNAETLKLIDIVKACYLTINFKTYEPHPHAVADYVANHGLNAFYESGDLRKLCCFIRKVEPLNRALVDADAWLTGQRREQSVTRTELNLAETDLTRGIAKYNPIFDWQETDVWAYILTKNIPFNELYHQGYPSIGCEPCTMPVKQGEDIRAGRWWWEHKDNKECGLHK